LNLNILNTEIQDFIHSNLKSDIAILLLKGIDLEGANSKEIIEQIEAKTRCEKKLPTWYTTAKIYYPNKLNIEQSSSEIAAAYKCDLISGNSLIDLTGGFGIDAYYFSQTIDNVIHCEINTELSKIVKHNFNTLDTNIKCLNESGIDALKRLDKPFDWIYIDPSRRDDSKKKVFLLSECAPNVKTFQNLFLKYAKNVMLKTSPLLDITATLIDLKYAKDLHIVAINNEVKELLWIVERDFTGAITVKTINILKDKKQEFNFLLNEELDALADYSIPLTYLYEPNSALLKAGAFKIISRKLNVYKLEKHSHLYTSEDLIDFPGRRFKIEKVLPFSKKIIAKENLTKANISTRNFPLSVGDIRKKLKIKDGGNTYLFFTTDKHNSKLVIICSKVL
jgi:16S rRNA G966 N2-methylase RsmD